MRNKLLHYTSYLLPAGVILLFICSCNSTASHRQESNSKKEVENHTEKKLTPSEYAQWFAGKENHLRKTVNANDLEYTLEYRSAEFVALQQLQKDEITKEELDTALKETEELVQFKLKIEVPGSGQEFLKHNNPTNEEYESRVKYFAFEIQKDLYLLQDDSDTIPCAMYHFERSYGISPASVILLGFAGADTKRKMEIHINEKVFATKILRFVFTPEEVRNIPQLKTL